MTTRLKEIKTNRVGINEIRFLKLKRITGKTNRTLKFKPNKWDIDFISTFMPWSSSGTWSTLVIEYFGASSKKVLKVPLQMIRAWICNKATLPILYQLIGHISHITKSQPHRKLDIKKYTTTLFFGWSFSHNLVC